MHISLKFKPQRLDNTAFMDKTHLFNTLTTQQEGEI